MRPFHAVLLLLVALAGCERATPPPPAPGPSEADVEYRAWLSYIQPGSTDGGWRSIRWRPRLWEGVREAQAADRPLLLWMMSGHPLGFT